MTWEEIKNKYPHQYVGLIDVKYGINNATIDSAVVKYTSSDLSYNELISLYLQGEMRTSIDKGTYGVWYSAYVYMCYNTF